MLGIGLFEALIILATTALMIFWLFMLVDCALNEPSGNDKIVWVVIIAVAHWLGAALYFFIRRPKRITQIGR